MAFMARKITFNIEIAIFGPSVVVNEAYKIIDHIDVCINEAWKTVNNIDICIDEAWYVVPLV